MPGRLVKLPGEEPGNPQTTGFWRRREVQTVLLAFLVEILPGKGGPN